MIQFHAFAFTQHHHAIQGGDETADPTGIGHKNMAVRRMDEYAHPVLRVFTGA